MALGAVSLFFQTYDNCRRLYDSLEELRHFGKDLRMSCARLRAIQWDLDALMEIRTTALRNPPDLDNQNHPVTKQILLHLTIILTYFTNCTKILEATYSKSDGREPRISTNVPQRTLVSYSQEAMALENRPLQALDCRASSLEPVTEAHHILCLRRRTRSLHSIRAHNRASARCLTRSH